MAQPLGNTMQAVWGSSFEAQFKKSQGSEVSFHAAGASVLEKRQLLLFPSDPPLVLVPIPFLALYSQPLELDPAN